MYPPLRQAEWIKFIGLLITSENFCTLKIQKKFGTTTIALQNALDWLLENHVTHVFFESTGQYWVPLFNIFSDSELNLILANPQHIKNVPGRKTDMKDAEWIAQLGRCGLIEPSYIPNPEVMQLRLLTRRLRSYKQRQTQIKNKIHNLLQRANIKLTSYLSDIFSKTGQSLLTLFINGELIDYDNVTACIHKHVKASPEEFNVGHEWEVVSEGSISLGPKPRRISIVSKTHEQIKE